MFFDALCHICFTKFCNVSSFHLKHYILGSNSCKYLLCNRFDQGYHNGYDADARGKYDRGRSRSPEKGSGLGDRSRNWNRERSRSRSLERFDRGPTVSFHKAMMERGRISPPPQRQHVPPGNPTNDRASSHSGGGEKANHGGSYDGHSQEWGRSSGDGPHSSYFGEEAEEGMIPQDEDGCN